MTSNPGPEKRRAMLRDLKQRQLAEREARMPLPRSDLSALFAFLDARFELEDCDHTLRLTRQFLREHSLPEEPVLAWLREYGGFCDCEVLGNVESEWG
jgi:hypothetical protein